MRGVNDATVRPRLSASLQGRLAPLKETLPLVDSSGALMLILTGLEGDVLALTQPASDDTEATPLEPSLSIMEWSDGFKARLGLRENRLAAIRAEP